MWFRLILLILYQVLEIILSAFLQWVLSLLWTLLKKKTNLLILLILLNRIKMATKNNIWKIIIGAVSAALGYILNAIGL